MTVSPARDGASKTKPNAARLLQLAAISVTAVIVVSLASSSFSGRSAVSQASPYRTASRSSRKLLDTEEGERTNWN